MERAERTRGSLANPSVLLVTMCLGTGLSSCARVEARHFSRVIRAGIVEEPKLVFLKGHAPLESHEVPDNRGIGQTTVETRYAFKGDFDAFDRAAAAELSPLGYERHLGTSDLEVSSSKDSAFQKVAHVTYLNSGMKTSGIVLYRDCDRPSYWLFSDMDAVGHYKEGWVGVSITRPKEPTPAMRERANKLVKGPAISPNAAKCLPFLTGIKPVFNPHEVPDFCWERPTEIQTGYSFQGDFTELTKNAGAELRHQGWKATSETCPLASAPIVGSVQTERKCTYYESGKDRTLAIVFYEDCGRPKYYFTRDVTELGQYRKGWVGVTIWTKRFPIEVHKLPRSWLSEEK